MNLKIFIIVVILALCFVVNDAEDAKEENIQKLREKYPKLLGPEMRINLKDAAVASEDDPGLRTYPATDTGTGTWTGTDTGTGTGTGAATPPGTAPGYK